jgi:hypothetical protein
MKALNLLINKSDTKRKILALTRSQAQKNTNDNAEAQSAYALLFLHEALKNGSHLSFDKAKRIFMDDSNFAIESIETNQQKIDRLVNALPLATAINNTTNLVPIKAQIGAINAIISSGTNPTDATNFNAVKQKIQQLESVAVVETNKQKLDRLILGLPAANTITSTSQLPAIKTQIAAIDLLISSGTNLTDATKLNAVKQKIEQLETVAVVETNKQKLDRLILGLPAANTITSTSQLPAIKTQIVAIDLLIASGTNPTDATNFNAVKQKIHDLEDQTP